MRCTLPKRLALTVLAASIAHGAATTASAFPGCPGSGQQSPGPDVIVGRLAQNQGGGDEIVNYASDSGIDAFSVGTTSCNLGDAVLLWQQSPDPDHPVIGQNCFRLKTVDGTTRFEHIGQSWLKHGFTALQQTACCSPCQPSGTGAALGRGCSDPYQAGRNGGQSSAGPKWQVNATTGVHLQPKANPGGATTTSVTRRLEVKITDLEVSDFTTASTKYFVEGQYVAADDAANGNAYNNASYRPLTLSGSGTVWTFGVFGNHDTETRRQDPAIYAWKEFDSGLHISELATPETDTALTGRVIVASKVTDLGGGTWHYEYAVQNLSSDRSIRSFIVPISPYAIIAQSSIGFHDVDYHSGDGVDSTSAATKRNFDGTEWPGVFSPANASVAWSLVETSGTYPGNANAIRWGTLYNFRFDCNLPPADVDPNATLRQYKVANDISAAVLAPQAVTCLPGDMNANGLVDGEDITRFSDALVNGIVSPPTPVEKCAGDREASPDFVIDEDDIDGFTTCVLNAGC